MVVAGKAVMDQIYVELVPFTAAAVGGLAVRPQEITPVEHLYMVVMAEPEVARPLARQVVNRVVVVVVLICMQVVQVALANALLQLINE